MKRVIDGRPARQKCGGTWSPPALCAIAGLDYKYEPSPTQSKFVSSIFNFIPPRQLSDIFLQYGQSRSTDHSCIEETYCKHHLGPWIGGYVSRALYPPFYPFEVSYLLELKLMITADQAGYQLQKISGKGESLRTLLSSFPMPPQFR